MPAGRVWAALRDQAVLARAIPGCDRFEMTGSRAARFTVTNPLPIVGGTYHGQLSAADEWTAELMTISVNASGDRGTISSDLTLRLAPAHGEATLVTYDLSAVIDGPVAGAGAL